jgi:hypothetical protein
VGSADATAGSSSLIIHQHRPFPIRGAGCLDHLIFSVSIAHKIALLRPILCRVRQRLLVFFKPYPIADVEIAAAYGTFSEMLCLGQSRSRDLFADDGPARARFVDGHDRGHVHPGITRSISHCLESALNSLVVFDLLFGLGSCEVDGGDLCT